MTAPIHDAKMLKGAVRVHWFPVVVKLLKSRSQAFNPVRRGGGGIFLPPGIVPVSTRVNEGG